jgi:hypothetical protein
MTVMKKVGNINGDVSNSKKAGKLVSSKIYILSEDQRNDLKPFPERINRGYGTIPLKPGEYWHYLKGAALASPELSIGGEMSDVGATLKNTVKIVCGGLPEELMTLIEEGVGSGFYIIVDICGVGRYIGGNGCKPMILQVPEGGAMSDKTSITLTFENQCGELFSKFTGTIQLQDPENIGAAAVAIPVVSGNDNYYLESDSSGAVKANATGIADSDINRIITIIGGGGSSPSKIDGSGNFLLTGGETWIAKVGSQISFKIFKDGSDSYKLVEMAGSRS